MRPPRPHGEVIEGRTVSFLELFYDLVFVVFVSQVAHALAVHPDGAGVRSFVVLFTLVWYTWLNGTLYHDLHGSNDGRSRTYMFVQMLLVSLMSVYAGDATVRQRGRTSLRDPAGGAAGVAALPVVGRAPAGRRARWLRSARRTSSAWR